ncbi:MAG TPA: hypothetical protein VK769_05355, partial [Verrucomicrobiae bacterium]|nr:hypothetical protein [Verrucomicrobiae bacterium]
MRRPLIIFYAIALAFHATTLFYLKPPAPKPPKIFNETYVDVTLTQPPPEPQKPIGVPPALQPKPEGKPQPTPPPKPEMTIPEPKPEPPQPVSKPVVIPPPQPKLPAEEYVPVTQPTFAEQAQHVYPPEAARRHQQ